MYDELFKNKYVLYNNSKINGYLCTLNDGKEGFLLLKRRKMKNKLNRLKAIRAIIANERVGSQEELQRILYSKGFEVTQATLSRDLKQLKVTKIAANDGSYIYVLPTNPLYKRMSKGQPVGEQSARNGFVSIEFSGNIAVIKTRPGYAGGIAYDVDRSELPGVLATVAGDDTILLVIKEGYRHDDVLAQLSGIVSGLE